MQVREEGSRPDWRLEMCDVMSRVDVMYLGQRHEPQPRTHSLSLRVPCSATLARMYCLVSSLTTPLHPAGNEQRAKSNGRRLSCLANRCGVVTGSSRWQVRVCEQVRYPGGRRGGGVRHGNGSTLSPPRASPNEKVLTAPREDIWYGVRHIRTLIADIPTVGNA